MLPIKKLFHFLWSKKKEEGLKALPLSLIHPNPYQPRREYKKEHLQELADSIKQHGVLQPIIVRKTSNGYEVVSGERRLRACQLLDLKTIPAIVGKFSDAELMEIALLENIQRKNLTILEEGLGYSRLQDVYQTRNLERLSQTIATRLGKNQEEIKARLELMNYSPLLQKALEENMIPLELAQLLSPLNPLLQRTLLHRIIRQTATREKVKSWIDFLNEDEAFSQDCLKDFLEFLEYALELLNDLGWTTEIRRKKEKEKFFLSIELEPPLHLSSSSKES